jgi:NTP pyrophosphatase (non-canonical NTP hydrolase)
LNITRLSEELGELAEAIRVLPVAPQYFVSEAPDVFAWLMGFANQFAFDRVGLVKPSKKQWSSSIPDFA